MQLRGKLTQEDAKDLSAVVRTKWYWPKILLRNWYGFGILAAVLWGTIAGLVGAAHPNWAALGIIWLVIIAIFAWSFYQTKLTQAKQFLKLNDSLPDWLTLGDDGVKFDGPNGATAFQPWRNFVGLREGKRVMLIDKNGGSFVILPVADLSESDRQSVRTLVRSHIGTVPSVVQTY